jgi:anti-anti-sigma factor
VVRIAGEFDLQAQGPVLEATRPLLTGRPGRPLVLDFEAVTFLDSSGLACLVRLSQLAAAANCELVVRNPTERTRRIFDLAGVTELLRVTSPPIPIPEP